MSADKRNTRFLTIGTVATISSLALVVVLCLFMREPTFEGRTVRSWLSDVAFGRGHASAVQFFRRNGSRTVPGLIPVIEGKVLRFPQRLRSHRSLFDHLPARVQKWATERSLRGLLLRTWAIEMCSEIGPDARGAERALMRACVDADYGVRAAAARALAKTQVEPAAAIPVLTRMLGDSEPAVRGSASVALGLYGDAARDAIPVLRTMATNELDYNAACSVRLGLTLIERPDKIRKLKNGYRFLP